MKLKTMNPVAPTQPVGTTAERLLDVAQQLIQQRGYHGFSYEDVSQAVGIRKASIHHHFPKKEDMGVRVLLRYTERLRTTLDEVDEEIAAPAGRLDAYITMFSKTYAPSRLLCPGGILGAETAGLPATVADAVKGFFVVNLTWLARLLESGRTQGAFAFKGDAGIQALALLSALEGSMVVGRGLGSDDSVQEVGKVLARQLLA